MTTRFQKWFGFGDQQMLSSDIKSRIQSSFNEFSDLVKDKLGMISNFLNEKSSLEIDIIVITVLLLIPISSAKRTGRYVAPVLSILFSFLSFMRVSIYVEKESSHHMFHGKLKIPELAAFALGLIMLELSLNSLITGFFGYHHVKVRNKNYVLYNSVKNVLGYAASVALNWGTFLSITEVAHDGNKAALLSIFPLIGILRTIVRLVSSVFVSKEENTWDTQEKSWDTNNVRMRSVIKDLLFLCTLTYKLQLT